MYQRRTREGSRGEEDPTTRAYSLSIHDGSADGTGLSKGLEAVGTEEMRTI